MKIVVVSGGFDPVHSGHIQYFLEAKKLGDKLIIALNSDSWLIKKKGKCFMPFNERKTILENLSMIDSVIDFIDDSHGTAINALAKIKAAHPNDNIIFANGGDRNETNIPEMSLKGIDFLFGVGGSDKKNSSSWILKNWQFYQEKKIWGKFYNLFETKNVKVKELIVEPNKGMSFQKHLKRSEIWMVFKGSCTVRYSDGDPDKKKVLKLNKLDYYHAKIGTWHQIINPHKEHCHLIEIQYGEECVEEDIERTEYYINS